ncbi:MAG TPA: hypothetical protein PK034_11095 [Rugosibacter sp.]|nr:hypothetical protein [Rugosibacter sp.]
MSEKKNKTLPSIILLLILLGIGWFLLQDYLEQRKRDEIRREQIKKREEFFSDVVRQYEITKRNGSAIDICIRAGAVAEIYLQAKDEPNYKKWIITAKADCEKAGIPMQ